MLTEQRGGYITQEVGHWTQAWEHVMTLVVKMKGFEANLKRQVSVKWHG